MARKLGLRPVEDKDYEFAHKMLGCYGCIYADQALVGKGPCCVYGFGPVLGPMGRCQTREEEG